MSALDVPERLLRTAVRKFQLLECAAASPDKTEKQAPDIGTNGADTMVLEDHIHLFPASLVTGHWSLVSETYDKTVPAGNFKQGTHIDTVVHRNHVVCEHTCKPSGIPYAHRQVITSQGS